MRQIVLQGNLSGSTRCWLDAKTGHYLIDVRRMRTGDGFEAMDETGNRFQCVILSDAPQNIEVALSPAPAAAPPSDSSSAGSVAKKLRIALVQALPKGQKFDLIVRQATELGTTLIVPAITQHCIGMEPGDRSSSKLERRRRIIREALQQSGSEVRTEIVPTVELADLEGVLEHHGFARASSMRILFHEAGQQNSKSLHELLSGSLSGIVVAIGPEGGFSTEDFSAFSSMGFEVYHAEGPVLRVETAAIFAISAIRAIALERELWKM